MPVHEHESVQHTTEGRFLEEELEISWVYRRTVRRGDEGAFSVISAAGRTASWSMLSGLSLSDNISIIAIQALPIYATDISNSEIYQFGEFSDDQVEVVDLQPESTTISPGRRFGIRSLKGRFDKITYTLFTEGSSQTAPSSVPFWRSRPQGEVSTTVNKGPAIFGIPIRQSIVYANTSISLVDSEGKSYVYGYVPIVVAKIEVFLKEKGEHLPPIVYELYLVRGLNDYLGTTTEDILRVMGLRRASESFRPFLTHQNDTVKALIGRVGVLLMQPVAFYVI